MNVLVVAAHPDDEVLGAGAAMATHVRRGDKVTALILGEGATSRRATRAEADAREVATLRACARRANEILGCRDVRLCDLPDNRFDSVDLLDIVKRVEAVVEELHPEIVYTHFHGDLNVDHAAAARAALTACRPLPGAPMRRILAFEVPSATGWGFPDHPFAPTVFLDAGAALEAKLEAMRAYESEVRDYPHPRSPQALAERARTWGSQVGLPAAEPFMLLREVLR